MYVGGGWRLRGRNSPEFERKYCLPDQIDHICYYVQIISIEGLSPPKPIQLHV